MFIDVGPVEQFTGKFMQILNVHGTEIGIVIRDGEAFAVRNSCPHESGPVCRGVVSRAITAQAVGAPTVVTDRWVLGCAWHGWEFDLRTGGSIWDPRYRLKTYPSKVEDGHVFVDLPVRETSRETNDGD